jgi:hypothetical protein
VFDALAPRLLPVAMHLCGHAVDAEDALQQTFLLAMLPAEQRQVLRLQLQHGMSPTAITEVLEVPPGAVRMRLHRGLEALRLDATIEDEGRHERHSARAGTDGSFRFEGVVDGLYTIALVSPPPGEVMPPLRHVRAGSTGLRLQLEMPSFVAGRVFDAAGKPVRACVHAIPDCVRRSVGGQLSDADGHFRREVPVGFRGRVEATVPSQQPEQPMVQGEQRDVAARRGDLQITVETRPFLRR